MILILFKRYKGMLSFKGVLQTFLVLILLLSLALHAFLSLNYATNLSYNKNKISIDRDQFNIPTITAPEIQSALYAWGYITAEDRLFQIGFRRQIGMGRLSQLFGEKGLALDKMMREINFYGQSLQTEKQFKRNAPKQFSLFEAYARGINDCVKNKMFLPMEYYMVGLKWQQWRVADSFLMFKLLKWSQSQNMVDEYYRSLLLRQMSREEAQKIFPFYADHWIKGQFATQETIIKDGQFAQQFWQTMKKLEVPKFTPVQVQQMLKVGLFDFFDQGAKGSNSWVIGGKHTESGHPLLANDPHLDSALPGEWQQIRVHYNSSGNQQNYLHVASLAGIPAFIGKTSYFSLSMTTTYSDTQDLYKQTLNEKEEYFYEGEWRPLKVRNQKIIIKGQEQPLQYKVYQTHHGPLIRNIGYRGYMYEVKDQNLALCWGGARSDEYVGLKDFIYVAETRSLQSLVNLLRVLSHHAPPMNMIFITQDDHYGYISTGPTPKRRHPHMGMFVQDGTKAENDWLGFVQPHERLLVIDNERGYIASANNKPSGPNFQNGIFDVGMFTAREDRIQRMIQQRIKSGKKFNKQYIKQMQFDTIDCYCQEVIKSFRLKLQEDRSKHERYLGNLEKFDCNFTSSATLPSLFTVFYQNVMEELKPNILRGKYSTSINYPFNAHVYKFLQTASSDQEMAIIQKAMNQALSQLKEFFGTSDISAYTYSKLHRDWMKHRPFSESKALKGFFQKDLDGWGNLNTPNVAVMGKIEEKDYRTQHRANIRIIVSYHEESQWIVDGGTSQTVYSTHYDDQNEVFMKGGFLPMDFPASKKKMVEL